MSDFIDRLAARAIGSETALTPRVPSLFESLPRARAMPSSPLDEAAPDRAEPDKAEHGPVTAAPTDCPFFPVPLTPLPSGEVSGVAAAHFERGTTSSLAPVVASTPLDVPACVSTPATPIVIPVVKSAGTSSSPAEAVGPLRSGPRQTRMAPEAPAPAAPSREANGALLSAPTPVFGAMRSSDPAGRSAPASTARLPAGAAGSSSEPVVHVTIGRLEVRATAASATPPRRRDDPQPRSLDDYLRQRGKASP